ncbi:hypothetical protein TYRP_023075 [Tyrophagus putrescentiae]|nr:hypothetical protein TYRP_023075 [Tyrophagus putrescentiae]
MNLLGISSLLQIRISTSSLMAASGGEVESRGLEETVSKDRATQETTKKRLTVVLGGEDFGPVHSSQQQGQNDFARLHLL